MKVITLQNNKELNEAQFLSYFEKKVLYTIRKFRLLDQVDLQAKANLNVKSLLSMKKIGPYAISQESLDDIALMTLEAFMTERDIKKRTKLLLPIIDTDKENRKIIRPFYFMTENEMNLYSKLKKIRLKKEKKSSLLSEWLDDFEKRHLEVKNAIVMSALRLQNR